MTSSSPIISGSFLFHLKDTMGFPLAMSLIECERNDLRIDWCGFVEAARNAGWWDFQTMDVINEAFVDSGVWADHRKAIEDRLKLYMMTHPLNR
jgi:alanyl-tRNA synthetase